MQRRRHKEPIQKGRAESCPQLCYRELKLPRVSNEDPDLPRVANPGERMIRVVADGGDITLGEIWWGGRGGGGLVNLLDAAVRTVS